MKINNLLIETSFGKGRPAYSDCHAPLASIRDHPYEYSETIEASPL